MDYSEVVEMCNNVIDKGAKETLQSDSFKKLNHESIKNILSRETMCIQEIDVWHACLDWAAEECKRQGHGVC